MIIGSGFGFGFGDAIAARRLAEAEHQVVVLERGPWPDAVPNRSLGLSDLEPLPQGAKAYTHGLRFIGSHVETRPILGAEMPVLKPSQSVFGDPDSL